MARSRPRIALVDDDRALLEVFRAYLADDFDVDVYEDPAVALAEISAGGFDLVVSDVRMPGLDGLALRRRLAADPDTDVVPFVFLTAQDDAALQDRAAGLGIDDYLVKPVRRDRLRRVVERVLLRAGRVRARLGDRLDRSITDCLRPALPARLGEWRTSLMARSASAGGGDFVHHRSHDGRHLLLLGDAVGHGEQAKFFAHAQAGFLQGLLSTFEDMPSPSDTLARLSNAMRREPVLKAAMMTCVTVLLEPDGRLRCAAAGHPPPLVAGPDGVRALAIGGLLPGLLDDYAYEELTIELGIDERLLLYTDGLFDAAGTDEGRQALEAHVRAVLVESSIGDESIPAERIARGFDALTGDDPCDDATFVLIERARESDGSPGEADA